MSTPGETEKFNKNCCLVILGGIMQRNAAVLTIICVMMCLTFNYTFPLHRKTPDSSDTIYPNQTQVCEIPVHQDTIAERTKKMATNIEQVLKRFKDSTSDFGKNIYGHVSSGIKEHINFISEDDLRQYEQMVIMKKYPYLDLKELELKFSPTKNTRQSVKLDHGANAGNEPGLCEPLLEDSPNVEITNRGLSGFAIPHELTKQVSNIVDNKIRLNSNKREDISKVPKKSQINAMLGSLKDDVKGYVEKRNKGVGTYLVFPLISVR